MVHEGYNAPAREVLRHVGFANALSTAAISSVPSPLLLRGSRLFLLIHVTNSEIAQKNKELLLKRRGERLEIYQTAIDLLTDWGWRKQQPEV